MKDPTKGIFSYFLINFSIIDKKTNVYYGLNRSRYPDGINDASTVNEIQMQDLVTFERTSEILQTSLLFLREPIDISSKNHTRYNKT